MCFFYQIFLVAVLHQNISSSPGLQRSSMGPSVLRSGPPRICCLCHEASGANGKKETKRLGKVTVLGISPPKKRGKFGWALFSHPTHPTQLLFFPGFLLLVWWNLAWNLCMNMFIMPVKHEVATTNEALEGYATQNFSRFITRSSFPKN